MVKGFQFLQREINTLYFTSDLDNWPSDVPLPPETVMSGAGADVLPPFWKFELNADKTLEIVSAWFLIPLNLEAGYAWFSEALTQQGWQEVKKVHFPPPTIRCSYHHREYGQQRRLEVHLFLNPHNEEVRVMIWRLIEHLYTSPTHEIA